MDFFKNWFTHEDGDNKNLPARRVREGASPFHSLHSEIDRVFDSFFRGTGFPAAFSGGSQNAVIKPSLDLKATDKEYQISIELPGVEEKDVSIEIEGGSLAVSGEKKSEIKEEDEKKGYCRVERSYGSFRRVLALPEDSDPEKIAAKFKNGVLDIVIPRKEPKEKKKIAITS